jgi:dipeptidyl aminopeptidase/acylaminoacyl peptidase
VSDGSNVIAATQGEIVILDLQSRRERILAEGDGVKYRPLWSADASRIVYLVGRSFAAPPNIRIVSLQSGKILDEYTLSGPIVSYDWDRSSSARDFIVSYVGGGEEGASRGTPIAHVRDDSFVISLGSGTPGPWSQARDGTLVWVEGGSAPFVWVSSADQQSARKLLTLTTTDVLAFGKVDTVAWRNSRGEDLNGSLLYPPDYVAGKKYPLIADVYPFPGPKGWMNPLGGNQAWASAGYVVFKPGPRAPHSAPNCSGSASFCEAGRGPGAWDVTVDDVMSGVSDLIRRGLVDADRMCLFGHSNGGGVANYLVTRTDKFKCAVVVAPVLPNWTGTVLLWGDGISLMADLAGAKLWEDPSAYVKLSAIFRADKVKTPMLIADGDNDGSFLLGSIELYNVLRAAGANVTLLRYPDQGHAFTGDALRDFWRREMDFFATYLQAR